MGFNRVADLPFDARNPRTRNRELPRGALTLTQAWVSVARGRRAVRARRLRCSIRSASLLSPVALAWVLTYSLSKRFTWWPHLWLGHEPRDRAGRRLSRGHRPVERAGLAAARGHRSRSRPGSRGSTSSTPCPTPASTGRRDSGAPSCGWASGGRSCWPSCCTASRFPRSRCSGGARASAPGTSRGWSVAAGILVYEHRLVRPGDLSRLDAAFFTMNGVMSVTVFAFALIDRLAR